MTQIWIRHGQCIANLQDTNYSFSSDEQDVLTEKGKAQANITALYLKTVVSQKTCLVSSSLTRAKQTSKIINNILNQSEEEFILHEKLLIEKTNIESLADCAKRINIFLQKIHKNENYLIVTHGHVLQALASIVLNLNARVSESLMFNNCGLTIIENNQKLIALNSISHFSKDLLT